MILKIWKDPVWSKVIAAAIITLFGIIATYAMGIWPSILHISHNVYTFLLESTLVDNWLLTIMAITSIIFFLFVLLSIKNKLYNANNELSLIPKLEEQILLSMAREGDNQYQIPFFVRVLQIDEAKAQIHTGHLADIGFIECDMSSGFPHYSMSIEGRNYLVMNGLL